MNLKNMLRIVAATTLLCVVVFIKIPWAVPITLQTFVVILIGLILTPKEALLSVLLYIGIGLIGLPVFASGSSFQALTGPAGGFLISFPISACLISMFKSKKRIVVYDILVLLLVIIVFTYILATAWYSYVLKVDFMTGLLAFAVYMGVDLVKIVVAYLVYKNLPQRFLDDINTQSDRHYT